MGVLGSRMGVSEVKLCVGNGKRWKVSGIVR